MAVMLLPLVALGSPDGAFWCHVPQYGGGRGKLSECRASNAWNLQCRDESQCLGNQSWGLEGVHTADACGGNRIGRRAGHICPSFPSYNGGWPIGGFQWDNEMEYYECALSKELASETSTLTYCPTWVALEEGLDEFEAGRCDCNETRIEANRQYCHKWSCWQREYDKCHKSKFVPLRGPESANLTDSLVPGYRVKQRGFWENYPYKCMCNRKRSTGTEEYRCGPKIKLERSECECTNTSGSGTCANWKCVEVDAYHGLPEAEDEFYAADPLPPNSPFATSWRGDINSASEFELSTCACNRTAPNGEFCLVWTCDERGLHYHYPTPIYFLAHLAWLGFGLLLAFFVGETCVPYGGFDDEDRARSRVWKVGTFLVLAVIPSFLVLAWIGGVAELIVTLGSLMCCGGCCCGFFMLASKEQSSRARRLSRKVTDSPKVAARMIVKPRWLSGNLNHMTKDTNKQAPQAVTVTAAAVNVTSNTIDAQLSAVAHTTAAREDPPQEEQEETLTPVAAAIAEDKVRDTMFKLDGASKAEASSGGWGELSWIGKYRRLQELGHIARGLDFEDLARRKAPRGKIHLPKFGTQSSGKEESDWVQDTRYSFEFSSAYLGLRLDYDWDYRHPRQGPQGWPRSITFPFNHMKSVRRAPGVNFDNWGIVITMVKGDVDLPVMRATSEAQMLDLLSALKACGLEEIVVDTRL